MGNERYNMLTGHRERMLCKFDEFSADTAENRFIKHGLRIARNMIAMMEDHRAYPVLAAKCNRCLTAFSNVSDARTLRLPAIKHNKLFRDYSEALRLASMLMRRRDISVSEHGHADEDKIPIVKCIILYPETRENGASFSYDLKAVDNIVKFFKCPVPLPVQNLQTTPTPT